MFMVDFEYDGQLLSDYDCIMATFDDGADEPTPLGAPLVLENVKIGDENFIAATNYEEVVMKKFDIVKNPCRTTGAYSEGEFTDIEVFRLSKWLQRKEYLKFRPIYNSGQYVDLVFYGRFDVQARYMGGVVIGFTLTLITNAPYGFADEEIIERTVDSETPYFEIYNNSQEYGYIYPEKMVVTCHGRGDLRITNTKDYTLSYLGNEQVYTEVLNCYDGEIITFHCKSKIIESSRNHPNLYNDFNYNFPRMITDQEEEDNRFEFEITEDGITSADVVFIHNPVRKVGVI